MCDALQSESCIFHKIQRQRKQHFLVRFSLSPQPSSLTTDFTCYLYLLLDLSEETEALANSGYSCSLLHLPALPVAGYSACLYQSVQSKSVWTWRLSLKLENSRDFIYIIACWFECLEVNLGVPLPGFFEGLKDMKNNACFLPSCSPECCWECEVFLPCSRPESAEIWVTAFCSEQPHLGTPQWVLPTQQSYTVQACENFLGLYKYVRDLFLSKMNTHACYLLDWPLRAILGSL